jgi:hypothetical protein
MWPFIVGGAAVAVAIAKSVVDRWKEEEEEEKKRWEEEEKR